MSIASDPNLTYAYVLESDRDKPKKSQPTFIFQVLTVSRYRVLLNAVATMDEGKGNDAVFDAAITLITSSMENWLNVKNSAGQSVPFDPKAIEDIASIDDLMELAYAVRNQQGSPEDKKKLSSQSESLSDSADPEDA